MDTLNRELSYSGTWKMTEYRLELTILTKSFLVDGEKNIHPGSVSGYAIYGGTVEKIILDEPEIIVFLMPKFIIDYMPYPANHKIELDGMVYWKFDFFSDLYSLDL
jgi:hypothetical protein